MKSGIIRSLTLGTMGALMIGFSAMASADDHSRRDDHRDRRDHRIDVGRRDDRLDRVMDRSFENRHNRDRDRDRRDFDRRREFDRDRDRRDHDRDWHRDRRF